MKLIKRYERKFVEKKVTKKSDPFGSIQLAKGFSMESFRFRNPESQSHCHLLQVHGTNT